LHQVPVLLWLHELPLSSYDSTPKTHSKIIIITTTIIDDPSTARLNETPGKINHKIDLDSPKVATMDAIKDGEKKVYCRCWLSGTFPLCDGSHVAHNKEVGDNVGPLIVSVAKEE